MSASETGDDFPFIHCRSSVPAIRSASAPASRTASIRSALSRSRLASATGNGQTFDPNSWRIHSVAELQVVRRRQGPENVEQMTSDRDFAHGIVDPTVLDPKSAGTAAEI